MLGIRFEPLDEESARAAAGFELSPDVAGLVPPRYDDTKSAPGPVKQGSQSDVSRANRVFPHLVANYDSLLRRLAD